MNKRKTFTVALAVILALTVCGSSAFSRHVRQIPGFHVIKQFPETMVAGFSYETELIFLNPRSQKMWLTITLEIMKKRADVNFGDFFLEGVLSSYESPPRKHYVLDIVFVETQGGIFQFEGWVAERFNYLTLNVSLSSRVNSDKYIFKLTVTLQAEVYKIFLRS